MQYLDELATRVFEENRQVGRVPTISVLGYLDSPMQRDYEIGFKNAQPSYRKIAQSSMNFGIFYNEMINNKCIDSAYK